MIIDTHTHVGRYPEIELTPGEKTNMVISPEMMIAAMDQAGIDHALVFAHEHKLFANKGITTEELLEWLKDYPRLYPIGTASPATLTGKKYHFLHDALQAKTIYGLKFYTGYEHFLPNDKRLHCLYKVLVETGLPAIFHMGFFWDPEKFGRIEYAKPTPIDDLACTFPDLKIVIAHIANPWIVDTAVVAQRHENVYIDISGYFTEFIEPFSEEEIDSFQRDLVELQRRSACTHKLLFATDWPINSIANTSV